MKTDKELKQLAKQIINNEIYWAWNKEMIDMSFMCILALADPEQLPKDIGSVYAPWANAGPRSINGYPMFFEAAFLTVEETKTVAQYIKEYQEMMKNWEEE